MALAAIAYGYFQPEGYTAGAWLGWGLFGLGCIAAVSAIGAVWKLGNKVPNIFLQTFVYLSAIGIGCVIFIISVVASVAAYFAKDPHALDQVTCG